jgi:hypothetical protein
VRGPERLEAADEGVDAVLDDLVGGDHVGQGRAQDAAAWLEVEEQSAAAEEGLAVGALPGVVGQEALDLGRHGALADGPLSEGVGRDAVIRREILVRCRT